MQHHRRLLYAGRQLQIADELFAAVERQLDDLQRRVEIFRRLAEHAQRMLVRLEFSRRIRRRIAADAAGVEGVHVKLGELRAGCAGLGTRVGLVLIAKPDLAPLVRPMILVEALQRSHHPLGILAADVLERIEPPGAAHELGLDLVERALARSGRFCRRGLQIHGRSLGDGYSVLILADRITLAHFSVSSAMSLPNSADVIDSGRTPKSTRRVRVPGSATMALIALLSLSMMAGGVA